VSGCIDNCNAASNGYDMLLFSTGIAASNAYTWYWVFSFLVNFMTPRLFGPPLYIHGYLYLIAFCNLLGMLFVLIAIPETKVRKKVSLHVSN